MCEMPKRQGVRKCDSFESMCCELRMHVCDWETNCFFGEFFLKRARNHLKLAQAALGVRKGRSVGQEGRLFFSEVPT